VCFYSCVVVICIAVPVLVLHFQISLFIWSPITCDGDGDGVAFTVWSPFVHFVAVFVCWMVWFVISF